MHVDQCLFEMLTHSYTFLEVRGNPLFWNLEDFRNVMCQGTLKDVCFLLNLFYQLNIDFMCLIKRLSLPLTYRFQSLASKDFCIEVKTNTKV